MPHVLQKAIKNRFCTYSGVRRTHLYYKVPNMRERWCVCLRIENMILQMLKAPVCMKDTHCKGVILMRLREHVCIPSNMHVSVHLVYLPFHGCVTCSECVPLCEYMNENQIFSVCVCVLSVMGNEGVQAARRAVQPSSTCSPAPLPCLRDALPSIGSPHYHSRNPFSGLSPPPSCPGDKPIPISMIWVSWPIFPQCNLDLRIQSAPSFKGNVPAGEDSFHPG